MKKIRVIGPGRKFNGKWCFDGDTEVITEEEYEKNKDGLEVIEEIETPELKKGKIRTIAIDIEDETIDLDKLRDEIETLVKNYKSDPGENEPPADPGENGQGNEGPDDELIKLREEGKNLGIKNAHVMGKETLIKKIDEVKKEQKQK